MVKRTHFIWSAEAIASAIMAEADASALHTLGARPVPPVRWPIPFWGRDFFRQTRTSAVHAREKIKVASPALRGVGSAINIAFPKIKTMTP